MGNENPDTPKSAYLKSKEKKVKLNGITLKDLNQLTILGNY